MKITLSLLTSRLFLSVSLSNSSKTTLTLMPGRWKISGMMSRRLSFRVPGTEVLGAREEVSMRGFALSEKVRVAGSDQGPSPPFSRART